MRAFDFEFGVEEEILNLLELFEGGDLSHSTGKKQSFDCDVGVEEESFETFEKFVHNLLTTYILEWRLGNCRQENR